MPSCSLVLIDAIKIDGIYFCAWLSNDLQGTGFTISGLKAGSTGKVDDSPSSYTDVQPLGTKIWSLFGDRRHGGDVRVM